jgi:hypothetical protein
MKNAKMRNEKHRSWTGTSPASGDGADEAGDTLSDSDYLDLLRTENRHLRASVHHLEVELRDAHERIAFLAQELARVRQRLPRGPSTS